MTAFNIEEFAVSSRTALEFARDFGIQHHAGQRYGQLPYVVHLDAVVAHLKSVGANQQLQVAGYLHDILEDTSVTASTLTGIFGEQVCSLVWAVTGEGNTRAAKVAQTVAKLQALPDARLLKLADRLANVEACVRGSNRSLLARYRAEQPSYHELFMSTKSPLYDKLLLRLAE